MAVERGSIQFLIDYKNLEIQQNENIPPSDPSTYPIWFRPYSNKFLIYNDVVKSYVYPVVGSIGLEGNYYPTSEIFSYLYYVENLYENLYSKDKKLLGVIKDLASTELIKRLPEKQIQKFNSIFEVYNLSGSEKCYIYLDTTDGKRIDVIEIDEDSYLSFELSDYAANWTLSYKGSIKLIIKSKISIFYYIQEVEGTPTPDKNVIDVASIIISSKPPILLDKLWFDTQTKILKYFDEKDRIWTPVRYNYYKKTFDIVIPENSSHDIYLPISSDDGVVYNIKEISPGYLITKNINVDKNVFIYNSDFIDPNSDDIKLKILDEVIL